MFANFLLRSKTAVASTKDAFFVLHGLGAIVGSAQFSLAKAEITSGSSISQETPKIAVSFFLYYCVYEPGSLLLYHIDAITNQWSSG